MGLVVPTGGSGGVLIFPASQSASSNANGLDDYEEGTWTPTLVGAGTAGTYTCNVISNSCKYVKQGRIVFISGAFDITRTVVGAGIATFGGLPFPKAANEQICGSVKTAGVDLTAGTMALAIDQISVASSGSTFAILQMQDNAASVPLDAASIDTGDRIDLSFFYFA